MIASITSFEVVNFSDSVSQTFHGQSVRPSSCLGMSVMQMVDDIIIPFVEIRTYQRSVPYLLTTNRVE